MSSIVSREVILRSRPEGTPTEENFEIRETVLPDLQGNQILIRNRFMSVDPYMRGRMRAGRNYASPFATGEVMNGGAVGEIVESNNPGWHVGDVVRHMNGWREYHISSGTGLSKIDESIAPMQAFLGVAGMPGQTAYFGLLRIGEPKSHETVFVSAASGAVGGMVCQIAKIQGCRVVGSVGSDEKAQWLLDEAGVDDVINYKNESDLTAAIAAKCPKGVDVYFENVGGAHLEAALSNMNMFGRIPCCGMISQYNNQGPMPGPSNLTLIVGNRLKLQGFIVSDFAEETEEFYRDFKQWKDEGLIKWQESIVRGIEKAPEAFIGLFSGSNQGKMLVELNV